MALGPDRKPDANNLPEQRIPRTSPAIFNLGQRDLHVLFPDGRIEVDPSRASGFRTPLEDNMVGGLASLLSAQTMFPVLSNDEMAGHCEENEVSSAVREGVTNSPAYAFRTPKLRNVTATAPYGHAGAHATLKSLFAFHINPKAGLASYTPDAILPAFEPLKPD